MKFSIPYNNEDPEKFISLFEPYKDHIQSIYFGLPGIFAAHNPFAKPFPETFQACANTYRFLELAKGKFETVLCINTLAYPTKYDELCFLISREIGPLVEQFGLSAVNLASPTLADVIHGFYPELDIQTSCNTYSFVDNMYYLWNERFGSTTFNLPREALRTPGLLDSFKKTGFKSKCIVNEGCIYGCPGNVEHAVSFIMENCAVRLFCDRTDYRLSDIFKSNFIPPHRLGEFDGKLDIVKIAGRTFPSQRILQIFLAYLNRDSDADIESLLHARSRRLLKENKIRIRAKEWPKKTLTCECKECRTCQICYKAMEHVIRKNGLDPATLTRRI